LIDRLPFLQLRSMIARGIQSRRILDLGLNVFKHPESFWVHMLKVNHVVADTKRLLEPKVQETLHDCGIGIIFALLEGDERIEIGLFTFVRVEDTATPKRGALVSDDVKTGDDSEIGLSAANGAIEI
jgi:hypothetical protein